MSQCLSETPIKRVRQLRRGSFSAFGEEELIFMQELKSEKQVSKAFPTGPTVGWRRILFRFHDLTGTPLSSRVPSPSRSIGL